MGQAAAKATAAARYRLEDLRRLATALGTSAGLTPTRGAALAAHLLWSDAAGRPEVGLATLPDWLRRIELGEVDAATEGAILHEHAATAVLDARHGVGPLLLGRAAGLAGEKARETGVGLVRVKNLGRTGPAAALVAELAGGPFLAAVLGPDGSLALALPTNGGPPLVHDSTLANRGDGPDGSLAALAGLAPLLVPEGEWLVQAVSVPAIESLAAVQERVQATLAGRRGTSPTANGLLPPTELEARRQQARERGVPVADPVATELQARAQRLGIAWPTPLGRS